MALAIDASTPAITSGTTLAVTTASFTTPAAVLLVAFVGRDNGTGDPTGTVSGAGLTWHLAGRKSTPGSNQIAGGSQQYGCVEIWWAYSASALTAQTVTDTRTTGGNGNADAHAMQVVVLTGAETTWAGAIAANGSSGGFPSVALTTTAAGSWVMSCSSDYYGNGNATAGTGQTIISQCDYSGLISIHFWRQTATTPTSGTTVTNNLTAPPNQQYNILSIEIRPSSTGGTPVVMTGWGIGI
jgi:hypothetical protein